MSLDGPMRRIVGVVSLRTLLYEEGVSPDAPARQRLQAQGYRLSQQGEEFMLRWEGAR